MTEHHGHMTHKDGSHTPLSKDQAAEIWAGIEADDARDAEQMPDVWDATRQIIRAKQRLRKLGWREGGGFSVKPGDECAVIELGSTGMWSGWLDGERKYVHYAGGVASPGKVWLKPLDDLTPDERKKMDQGDKDAAECAEQEIKSMIAMDEYLRGDAINDEERD